MFKEMTDILAADQRVKPAGPETGIFWDNRAIYHGCWKPLFMSSQVIPKRRDDVFHKEEFELPPAFV